MFFKKATQKDEVFIVVLTLFSKCQIDGEDFVNFCGLLRKYKLYFVDVNVESNFVFDTKIVATLICNLVLMFFFFSSCHSKFDLKMAFFGCNR